MAIRRVRGEIRESAKEREANERTRVYERMRDELSKRQLSNAENLDKTILTYSGAGLALSLGFLKDFVPMRQAMISWALYGSWLAFTIAMSSVVVSYFLSLKVLNLQLDRAERYYLDHDEGALSEKARLEVVTAHINEWFSAAAFVIGLCLTVLFVSINLSEVKMGNKSDNKTVGPVHAQDGAINMQTQRTGSRTLVEQAAPDTHKYGATSMGLQRVERGVTGAAMQPVASGTKTPAQPASQSQSGAGTAKPK